MSHEPAENPVHFQIFDYFADLIYRRSGIFYPRENYYQLESRLNRTIREFDLESLETLHQLFLRGPSPEMMNFVLEIATNNETSFFRDRTPFDAAVNILKGLLPKVENEGRGLRVWSAACSTGQEPYSLVMALEEKAPEVVTSHFQIEATDINQQILDRAKKGIFDKYQMERGLPPEYKEKYFEAMDEKNWQIRRSVRDKVLFSKHNLFSDGFKRSYFDLIFCRNVLIYQKIDEKQRILEGLGESLKSGGYLILGSSESILGHSNMFEIERISNCTVNRRKPAREMDQSA